MTGGAADPAAPIERPTAALGGPGWWVVRSLVPDDEAILLAVKPHPLFILLSVLGPLTVLLGAAAVGLWLTRYPVIPWDPPAVLWSALVGLVLLLGWQTLEWLVRIYVLTDRRIIRVSGVLRQVTYDVPLARLQLVAVYKSLRERVFWLGTLGFASAGTSHVELTWYMVARPADLLDAVRSAADRYAGVAPEVVAAGGLGDAGPFGRRSASTDGRSRPLTESHRMPVIGLAGGIGAGKSEVASVFARLGCVVLDSDAEARAALDRPEVRARLVEWWGRGVLTPEGRVDRGAVAGIVFGDPAQRRRLEELVHPLVQASRRDAIARAAADRPEAPAVVVDAPLLFEAGVDRECDAVVYVDAPRETRLARVARTRGWDEAELARREAAQLPLEEKRRRADYVLVNDSGRADLDRRIGDLLGAIRARAGESSD